MAQGALSNLRVIEFADFISGPYCGKLMADLGADVVKVEAPGVGDPARHYGPFPGDVPHPEKSLLFAYLNTNKKSITLDVRTSQGRKVFLDLVRNADVLIENHPPRVMEELGLDYPTLSAAAPGLIVTSISPFGQTGPHRDFTATELITMMAGGIGYATPGEVEGWETHPPLKAPGHSGDFLAAITGAAATMVAVTARDVTGRGQHVDVSRQESLAVLMRSDLVTHLHEGATPSRVAGMGRTVASRRPLRCKDGFFSMQLFENHFWEAMKRAMGHPDWTELDIFQDLQSRRDNLDALMPLIEDWAQQYTREELYQKLQVEQHIPCLPVNTIADLFTNPHYTARGTFIEMEHPTIGTFLAAGPAYRFSEPVWAIAAPAPALGQHNAEVLCGRLGYTEADLLRMGYLGMV